MKKTMTVNISGVVFHIDEDAYEKLNRYLEKIREYFKSDEGCDEIISGIESRLAEMFQEKKGSSQQVISLADVQEAISQLGEPSQISGEEKEDLDSSEAEVSEDDDESAPKRLFRDPDNKYIGGVCGGLGAYFQIDPTWIRVIFLLTIFAYSFGLILYIILWIVIPKARSTADRLSMRGEKINLSNIEKSIKEDLRDIKKNLSDLSKEKGSKKKIKTKDGEFFDDLGDGFSRFFEVLFRIVSIFAGIIFTIVGVSLLAALISLATGFSWLVFFPAIHLPVFTLPEMLEYWLSSYWLINLAMAGLMLTIGIPVLLLVVFGLSLMFKLKGNRQLAMISLLLWIIGIGLLVFAFLSGMSYHMMV